MFNNKREQCNTSVGSGTRMSIWQLDSKNKKVPPLSTRQCNLANQVVITISSFNLLLIPLHLAIRMCVTFFVLGYQRHKLLSKLTKESKEGNRRQRCCRMQSQPHQANRKCENVSVIRYKLLLRCFTKFWRGEVGHRVVNGSPSLWYLFKRS